MAASQLLRALRGGRSQVAFSRKLQYRSNVACDWEAGRRYPTAARTLAICHVLKIDVEGAFFAFQPACTAALRDEKEGSYRIDCWLEALRGSTSVAALSQRSKFSRYAVGRWLSGRAKPRLPEFLSLVHAMTGRASDLVRELVSIEAVPELLPDYERRQAAKRIAFDAPWTEAVLRLIETEGYRRLARHESGYLAKRLGIRLDQEQDALARLEAAGILGWHHGRYRDIEPFSVDTNATPDDIRRLKMHWTEVCMQRLEQPRNTDWLAYNVISVSAADLERIREILRAAFREIRAVAAGSDPVQTAALLNLQLVAWPDE